MKDIGLIKLTPIFSALLFCFTSHVPAQTPGATGTVVEINVTARQFKFEPASIVLKKGQRAKITITSDDVDHGFAISEFNINEKIKAGKTRTVEFTPDRTGHFRIFCSVYCGDGHVGMTGELIVEEPLNSKTPALTSRPESQTGAESSAPSNIHVSFDDASPGVVFVESAGERIRIDTTTHAVKSMAIPQSSPNAQPGSEPPEATAQASKSTARPGDKVGAEPYDYRLVNVPTPKRVVKGSLNLYFTHRFSEPVKPLRQSARDLLGLDSFAISSLGLFYGVTDRLYVSAYRSPVCQTGICKTIEIGAGYHWLDEVGRSPLALSTYASIEGEDNFSNRYTYNLQAMMSRSVTKYVHVFFSPAIHINSNGQHRFERGSSFDPQAIEKSLKLGRNTGSFGFGVNARIRPSTSLLFEYTPRVGFKLGSITPLFDQNFNVTAFKSESEAEIGFGIERDIGRHSFSLTFSNTQTTTTSRYNSSNLVLPPKRFLIGFNLYRRFLK